VKRLIFLVVLSLAWLVTARLQAKSPSITLEQDAGGALLRVDGKPFMIKGVVWGYGPIGTNYSYSLWKQPRALILRVLDQQMPLLKAGGFNAIRVFDMPPPEWIQYIYEKYGIFTTVNDMLGRYGMTMNGVWIAHTDYADPEQRRFLLGEFEKMVLRYRSTPGVLMWLLGNENNYGLSWTGAGAENFPGEKDPERAAHLYSLMSEAAQLVKRHDRTRPVALVNGDLNYLDVIAKHKTGLDIFGTNQYRGRSVGAMYRDVKQKVGIPVLFTEFGADCFNNRTGKEDSLNQARFLHAQWREIYEESHGKGGAGTALGGFVFEWTDTWWKVGLSYGLSDHDTLGTWSHPPYYDYEDPSENNMQEEWWGITALTPSDSSGFYKPEPRTAFYMLRDIFGIDPYAQGTTVAGIRRAFAAIRPDEYQGAYLGSEAAQRPALRVSNLLLKLEMTASRGTNSTARGGDLRLDHTEAALVDFTLEPSSKLHARLSLSFVGNVAQNRLDPIFYENPTTYEGSVLGDARRTRHVPADIYQAEVKAQHRWFNLHGFYRVGHEGWDYEGDLFHLYPQAFYQEAVDIYRAPAPFGAVVSGRRAFEGFKLALGPQLYWGANPAVIGKYSRKLGPVTITAIHQEDLAEASSSALGSSAVTPEPVSRKSMLGVSAALGEAQLDVGGLFAAPQRVGDEYTRTEPSSGAGYGGSGYDVFREKVQWQDTLGAKVKLLVPTGRAAFYVQSAFKGLVADAGPDTSSTITGWSLKESGRGNQVNGLAGVAIGLGDLQIAPNVLYQRPLVGPNPRIDGVYDPVTQTYLTPVRARTTYSGVTPHEPFAVLDNRETAAGELLVTYDPTPATQFYQWDRFNREDAPFAANVDFVYRHQPTSRDSEVGVLDNGQRFAFGAAPPAHDTWDVTLNVAAAAFAPVRLFGSVFAGQNQALGDDPRLVTRYGGSLRIGVYDFLLATRLHLNDWGPYDYFRDYNLTYPLQWYGDASWGFLPALVGTSQTRFGVRGQYRRLDRYSDGWANKLMPGRSGSEFEITTYLHAAL
jgi:beta-galactosidase